MNVKTGSYVGDGANPHAISGIGFQPAVVIIKRKGASPGALRSSSVVTDLTKDLTVSGNMFAGGVVSFGADGFSVGADARVNTATETYFYLALQADAADLKVGTYTGNGLDDRSIPGVGFQPDFVIVYRVDTRFAVWRSSDFATDFSLAFINGNAGNNIQALEADGFQVGTSADVNANLATYHYIAVKKKAGVFNTKTYTGNGADDRSLSGLGFQPTFVHTGRGDGGAPLPVARFGAETGDASMRWNAAEATNFIQALEADGFQVGTDTSVNQNLIAYYAWAFKDSAPPTPADAQVHLLLKRRHWNQRDTAAPFL